MMLASIEPSRKGRIPNFSMCLGLVVLAFTVACSSPVDIPPVGPPPATLTQVGWVVKNMDFSLWDGNAPPGHLFYNFELYYSETLKASDILSARVYTPNETYWTIDSNSFDYKLKKIGGNQYFYSNGDLDALPLTEMKAEIRFTNGSSTTLNFTPNQPGQNNSGGYTVVKSEDSMQSYAANSAINSLARPTGTTVNKLLGGTTITLNFTLNDSRSHNGFVEFYDTNNSYVGRYSYFLDKDMGTPFVGLNSGAGLNTSGVNTLVIPSSKIDYIGGAVYADIAHCILYITDGGQYTSRGAGHYAEYDYVATSGYLNMVMPIPVSGVYINRYIAAIYIGSTTTLIASVEPPNAFDRNVTWASSDTSVAQVSGTGVVTAIGPGKVTITVKTDDGNKTASCPIIVPTIVPLEWAQTSASNDWSDTGVNSVSIDSSGNLYAAGSIGSGTSHFGGISVISASPESAVLIKYNSNGTAQWVQTAKGIGLSSFKAVAIDRNSGDIYVGGYIHSTVSYIFGDKSISGSSGGIHGVIGKYNSEGTVQWIQPFSSGSMGSDFSSLAVDSAGCVYVAGQVLGSDFSFGNQTVHAAGLNVGNAILAKYNSSGSELWARTTTLAPNSSSFDSISVDHQSNSVYVVGKMGSNTYAFGSTTIQGSLTNLNPLMVKFDSEGNDLWARSCGGNGYGAIFTGVAIDPNGNAYVVGELHEGGNYVFGEQNLTSNSFRGSLLIKYDGSGNTLWAKTNSYTGAHTLFKSVAFDPNSGDIYAIGRSYSSSLGYATFDDKVVPCLSGGGVLVKYNSIGVAKWAMTVGLGEGNSSFNSAAIDSSGHCYVGGSIAPGTFSLGTQLITGSGGALIFKCQ